MKRIALFLFLILSAITCLAQTQIDPTYQIAWNLLTGSGAPSISCTQNGNYTVYPYGAEWGQSYQDTTNNVRYNCTSTGWMQGAASSGIVPIVNGGTGATTAAGALANLGGASLNAANSFTNAGTTTFQQGSAGIALDATNQIIGTTFGIGGNLILNAEGPTSTTGASVFLGASGRADADKNAITFNENNTEYARIDGNYTGHTAGNVGIRTSSPTWNLSVGASNQWGVDSNGTTHQASTAPTSSAGSVATYSTNAGGEITGLSAATSVTITFANSGWTSAAFCVANASTTLATNVYNSAQSKTAVTFTVPALTGVLFYHCDGN